MAKSEKEKLEELEKAKKESEPEEGGPIKDLDVLKVLGATEDEIRRHFDMKKKDEDQEEK